MSTLDCLPPLSIGEHRLPCPECSRKPSDRTFGVTVAPGHTVAHCFRCGLRGSSHSRDSYVPRRTPPAPPPLEWSDLAEHIWRLTQNIRGTLGETYLQHRGCAMPPRDSHLRYLPPDDQHPPTLCAAVTDAITAKPLSLHRTRLAPDGRGKAGTDADRLLLKGHRKQGGVIRLWPDDAVHGGLAIAEGIETALAAAHVYAPVWAAIDAGNLASFPVLAGIEALTVIADHDDVGQRAAEACAKRWDAAGREVYIVTPTEAGADVADVVMSK